MMKSILLGVSRKSHRDPDSFNPEGIVTNIKRVLGGLSFLAGAAVGITGLASVLGASQTARDLMPEWYVRALAWMIVGFACAVGGLLVLLLDRWEVHKRDRAGSKARRDTAMPLLGGLMAVLAGYLCLLGAFSGLVGDMEQVPVGFPSDLPRPDFPLIMLMTFLSAPFGLAAMIAGSFAVFKQEWSMAFGGAVLGAVGATAVFWVYGAVIGWAGVALILLSKDEFI